MGLAPFGETIDYTVNGAPGDPAVGMFIQPDWFEVTLAGVGTNRYAYSGNDPVNMRDPNGNFGMLGTAFLGGAISLSIDLFGAAMSGKSLSGLDVAKSFGTGFAAGLTGFGVFGKVSKAISMAAKSAKHGQVIGGVAAGATAAAVGNTLDQAVTVDEEGVSLGDVDLAEVANEAAKGGLTGGLLGGAEAGAAVASQIGKASRTAEKVIGQYNRWYFWESNGPSLRRGGRKY